MAINVTPIPKLSAFATPTITFGTAAAGTAPTVIRSDATIAGVGAQTSVDETIARYNGTAGQLQGYSSLPPTISDAGIISLTSGALKFPATAISSSDLNVLDDYEEGTFTPTLLDGTLSPSESQAYTQQLGFYTKIGNRVLFSLTIATSSIGSLTGSQKANIGGLPFVAQNTANLFGSVSIGFGNDWNLATAQDSPAGSISPNTSHINLWLWMLTSGPNNFTVTMWSSDGSMYVSGQYQTAT